MLELVMIGNILIKTSITTYYHFTSKNLKSQWD